MRFCCSILIAIVCITPASASRADCVANPNLIECRAATGGATTLARHCTETFASCQNSSPGCSCTALGVSLLANLIKPPPSGSLDLTDIQGWIPTVDQDISIRTKFVAASDLLERVTGNQLTLTSAQLFPDNTAPSAAVQLVAGQCAESPTTTCIDDGPGCHCVDAVRAQAHSGGWGNGGRMVLGPECLRDPKCFVHEFMHFFSGVRDEYETGVDDNHDGVISCGEGFASNFDTTGSPVGCRSSGNDCLMAYRLSSGTSIAENLCLAHPDHDPTGKRNEQSQCQHHSCWEEVAHQWPSLTAGGAGAPSDIIFVDPADLTARAVLVIDRSGSMLGPVAPTDPQPRIDNVVEKVNAVITALRPGTEIAIVSFGQCAPWLDAVQEYPSSGFGTDRAAAIAAVAAIKAKITPDCFTPIPAGLHLAAQILGPTPSINSQVFVLTDGINNVGSLPPAVDEVVSKGVKLARYCVGAALGNQCESIGNDANFVADLAGAKLTDALVDFVGGLEKAGMTSGSLTSGADLASPATDVPLPAGTQRLVYFRVEPGVKEVRFFLAWNGKDSDLAATLTTPSGTVLPPSAFEEITGTGRLKVYRVASPASGEWRLTVSGVADKVAPDERFTMRALFDTDKVFVGGGLAASRVAYPQPFVIGVAPSAGLPLVGCTVTAQVTKPKGGTEDITLHDDGTGGDSRKSDGLYQAAFNNFTEGDGVHEFVVKVTCPDGTRAAPGEFDTSTPIAAPHIGAFNRTLRFSGIAQQVPANLLPAAAICHNVLRECSGPTTPVFLEGQCSSDPEGKPLSYSWTSADGSGSFSAPTSVQTDASFPVGVHEVRLVVKDSDGAQSPPSTAIATIQDTTPPAVTCLSVEKECTGPMTAVTTTCTAQDVCSGPAPVVKTADPTYSVGAHSYSCVALDASFNGKTVTCPINILDRTRPTFTFVPKATTITQCARPDIGQAKAADICGAVVITSNAPAVFPLGQTVVTWTATDPSGNKATATQVVTASLGDDPSCCPGGTKIIIGTQGGDVILGTAGRDCILARGGGDTINAMGGDDFVSGGAGDDTIDSGDGNDLVMGGAGRDTIMSGNGNDTIDGGSEFDVCNGGGGSNQLISCEQKP
jgi:hypothetical protein